MSQFHLCEYALYEFLETNTDPYTPQKVVASFGRLISYYNKGGLTHISQVLLYMAIINGVG